MGKRKNIKICIVIGSRPEIIKMSPIIRECVKQKLNFFVVHTGQHYDYNLDGIMFKQLKLPKPKYNLRVGSDSPSSQLGKIMYGCEQVFLKEKPDVVLVQGDTRSVLGGAIAACNLHIKVGHVEAGLRSFDRMMEEENNRVMTDHISDYLFCPTEESRKLVLKEGVCKDLVYVTGNTIVDAVLQNVKLSKNTILKKLKLKNKEYFLLTMHRPSNVDNKELLKEWFKKFKKLYEIWGLPIVFPIHPRTKKMVEKFKLKIPEGLKLIQPVGFLDFLKLEENAKLLLNDSGGIQEEGSILNVPCVTLRDNTERPETLTVGANVLANPKNFLARVKMMLTDKRKWKNPYGKGDSAERIINIIKEDFEYED